LNIVIVSAFRDSSNRYIRRYLDQVENLIAHVLYASSNDRVRISAIEGDSKDNTHDRLLSLATARGLDLSITTHNHGKRKFGSTEEPERLAALTGVMLAGMSSIDPSRDDVVLYVESDILWEPHVVKSLLDLAYRRQDGFDVIAPMIWAGDHFYDVFLYRKNGSRFAPFPPYHSDLTPGLCEVDSAGSCLCFRSELVRDVKVSGKMGLLSWCESAREQRYRIAVDTYSSVRHP
jgi:hypothetical protein